MLGYTFIFVAQYIFYDNNIGLYSPLPQLKYFWAGSVIKYFYINKE